MSKATHTPGPWAAFYKHKYNEWHVSVPVSNSDMRLSIFPDGIPGDTPEEAEGNARLIAAAPDLLALLEKIDNLLAEWKNLNYINYGKMKTRFDEDLERIELKIEEVIAAAKESGPAKQ